jgi:uncharacterized protein YndB with AHSA1/START domain
MLLHVRRERHVDAPREEVWEEVADPERWLGRPTEVEEVTPGRRIAFTWCDEGEADATIVEVTLDDEGDGTRVVVVEAPLERVRAVGPAVQRALPAHGPLLVA